MSPMIVAEMGASHCGSLEKAMKIVEAAAIAGADSIKLQSWSEGAMSVDARPLSSGPWRGRALPDLYRECRTPWEWHGKIFERARELGLLCFSTPFDRGAVDFLETLGCPIYKIASFEVTHLDLIGYVASKGKPVIISTGMATEDEIQTARLAAKGALGVTLLRCVSAYPAPAEQYGLRAMEHMRTRFMADVGISDHTLGHLAACAATAMGATVVEKHLGLFREGPDGAFVSTPGEFAEMVREVRAVAAMRGEIRYGPTDAERDSVALRRSWWAVADIAEGEPFTATNVAFLRPLGGLEEYPIGRAARALARGEPVTSDCCCVAEHRARELS